MYGGVRVGCPQTAERRKESRFAPPLLTEKVKLLIPAIACFVVATLFLVDLAGADMQRSANDEPGHADPVKVVRPDDHLALHLPAPSEFAEFMDR